MNNIKIPQISVQALKQQLDRDESTCLIDVREPHEWDEAHIPGAIHLQKDTIEHHIHEIAPNRSQPIFLQCRSGQRSRFAALLLAELGYENVINVEGGILDWISSGYPVNK